MLTLTSTSSYFSSSMSTSFKVRIVSRSLFIQIRHICEWPSILSQQIKAGKIEQSRQETKFLQITMSLCWWNNNLFNLVSCWWLESLIRTQLIYETYVHRGIVLAKVALECSVADSWHFGTDYRIRIFWVRIWLRILLFTFKMATKIIV
jgi:hypothetical protein